MHHDIDTCFKIIEMMFNDLILDPETLTTGHHSGVAVNAAPENTFRSRRVRDHGFPPRFMDLSECEP